MTGLSYEKLILFSIFYDNHETPMYTLATIFANIKYVYYTERS